MLPERTLLERTLLECMLPECTLPERTLLEGQRQNRLRLGWARRFHFVTLRPETTLARCARCANVLLEDVAEGCCGRVLCT
jgi:hypothetical protein